MRGDAVVPGRRLFTAWIAGPLRLAHFPGVLAAVVGAAAILALTVGAAPLLLSSAGSAALHDQMGATSGGFFGGIRFTASTTLSPDGVSFRERLVRSATRGLPFESPVLTVAGSMNAEVSTGKGSAPVQLLTRDGFEGHVRRVAGTGRAGFFVAASVARKLAIRPGDTVTVGANGVSERVPVAGVYRDLLSSNIDSFWFPVVSLVLPKSPDDPPPPQPLLADTPRFLALEGRLIDQGTLEFDLSLRPGISLGRAREVTAAIGRIQASRFAPASSLAGAFDGIDSGLPQLVKAADDTVSATSQPLRAVSLAGTLVALVVAGAAGAYSVRRRRTEIGLLSARGVGPGGVAFRSATEAILPVVLGTVAGWALAIVLVKAIGPSPMLESGSLVSSLGQAAVAAVVAVVLLALAAGAASRGETPELRPGRFRAVAARWPWEAAALAAAGASLYEILTRGTGPVGPSGTATAPKLDLLVLLFPFLFVAGTSGLAVRWLRGSLPKLKRASSSRSPWAFLAASRLASAPRAAASLVAAAALALGVLTYAGVLASSISSTAAEKSTLSIGSDVALNTAALPVVTGHPGFAWTPVTRLPDLLIVPQSVPADVLAVDPRTFARAAFWNSRLGPPLESLMRLLRGAPAGQMPALVAGGSLGPGTSLSALGKDVPLDPVASLGDFPGARTNRITLVVDQQTLERVGQIDINGIGHFYELWARGDPRKILPYLQRIGLPTDVAATAQKVRTTPAFLALSWTFGVLEAFGVLAGLIAALGVILYLQARQQAREVSYALARRMGLAGGSHLRSVAAELGAMLATAFVLGGAFAYVAAALVHQRLDPIPGLPPKPFLVTPVLLFAASAGSVILVSVIGAWWVQRRADRANPAEVMRLAG